MTFEIPENTKPLFSANYTLTPAIVTGAATAMDTDRIRHVLTGATIASLLGIIILLLQQPPNYWVYVAICFCIAMGLGFLSNDTHRLHMRRLAGRGFIVPYAVEPELLRFRVDVYQDGLYVKGPGSAEATYHMSDLKHFWCDEDTIVMRFSNKDFAVVPRSSMSNSRYLNLIDFLDHRTK